MTMNIRAESEIITTNKKHIREIKHTNYDIQEKRYGRKSF